MRSTRLADVSKRLLLAAESLRRDVSESDVDAFTVTLLRSLGIASDDEITAREKNNHRSGLTAAPAPGGHRGDTGHNPSTAHFRAELTELQLRIDPTTGGEETEGKPEEIRRVAELVELLEGEQAALLWWHRAAQAGDPLAALISRDLS